MNIGRLKHRALDTLLSRTRRPAHARQVGVYVYVDIAPSILLQVLPFQRHWEDPLPGTYCWVGPLFRA